MSFTCGGEVFDSGVWNVVTSIPSHRRTNTLPHVMEFSNHRSTRTMLLQYSIIMTLRTTRPNASLWSESLPQSPYAPIQHPGSHSPQVMYHQPTKPKENHTSRPENPLILLRPPLHHPNSFPTDPQSIRDAVQSLLRPLQNLFLLPQIPEHGASPLEVLV